MLKDSSFAGINRIIDGIGEGIFDVRDTTAIAIANEIMDHSKELVPVDTGNLKSSGYTGQAIDGKLMFGYGEPNDSYREPKDYFDRRGKKQSLSGEWASEYAWIVHEDLETPHEIGQAKYLEIPINKKAYRLTNLLAESFEDILAKRKPVKWRGSNKQTEP